LFEISFNGRGASRPDIAVGPVTERATGLWPAFIVHLIANRANNAIFHTLAGRPAKIDDDRIFGSIPAGDVTAGALVTQRTNRVWRPLASSKNL
jgi:hypothetical protein